MISPRAEAHGGSGLGFKVTDSLVASHISHSLLMPTTCCVS